MRVTVAIFESQCRKYRCAERKITNTSKISVKIPDQGSERIPCRSIVKTYKPDVSKSVLCGLNFLPPLVGATEGVHGGICPSKYFLPPPKKKIISNVLKLDFQHKNGKLLFVLPQKNVFSPPPPSPNLYRPKHAGQVIYANVKTETDLKIIRDKGKEDRGHSQQIKLNNFTVSFTEKRKEILNRISTATEA